MIYTSSGNDGGTVINLTVGDDASLSVPLKTDDGVPYEMDSSEYLIFNVREKANEESPLLINLRSSSGDNTINFSHADTADLKPGYYSAEVQLMARDGKRITVWPKLSGGSKISQGNRKNFCLMSEVVFE